MNTDLRSKSFMYINCFVFFGGVWSVYAKFWTPPHFNIFIFLAWKFTSQFPVWASLLIPGVWVTARPEIVENPMRSHRWTCMMLQNSVTDRQLSNSVLKIWKEYQHCHLPVFWRFLVKNHHQNCHKQPWATFWFVQISGMIPCPGGEEHLQKLDLN